MLKTQYEKAFSVSTEDAVIDDPVDLFSEAEAEDSSDPSIPYIHITHQDVIEVPICQCQPRPDYFPDILLKKDKLSLCDPLTQIFRSSLETGEIPDILKCAFITSAFKGGIKSPIQYLRNFVALLVVRKL